MSEIRPANSDGSAILVVDDNDDNRFTLVSRLELQGYQNIVEAVDGHDALEALRRDRVELVLLDVMMPGMSGYEVLEHIKSDMALRSIPVIMISALDEIDSVVKCIELGAEDYLTKPFNATLLQARIGAAGKSHGFVPLKGKGELELIECRSVQ